MKEFLQSRKKVSGYKDEALIGTNSELAVSDSNTWFRSTRSDPSNVPTSKSTVVMKASPIYVTGFRAYGNGVSTGIGYDSKVKIYPEWQDPVKSPTVQIKNRGEVATFDVVEDFPYVADTNKAASIVMSDELDPALDASYTFHICFENSLVYIFLFLSEFAGYGYSSRVVGAIAAFGLCSHIYE